MSGGSRLGAAQLRLVNAVSDGHTPASEMGDGLAGCDPGRFVLLGYAHDRRRASDDGAYPSLDVDGGVHLAPGERRLGTWRGFGAIAERRAPGGARPQGRRRWREQAGPTVTLTDRRVVVHGPSAHGDGAHLELERIQRVRATVCRVRGLVAIETLLHCQQTGASAELLLQVVVSKRGTRRLFQALAAAHRARWERYDLPAPVAGAITTTRPRRSPLGMRYEPAVFMPLGVTDAIRGAGAGPGVPQRVRAPLGRE